MSVFRTDRHLASPVLDSELVFIRKNMCLPSNLKSEHRLLVRDYPTTVRDYDWLSFQSNFVKHIEKYPPYHYNERAGISRALQVALRVHMLNTERCLSTTVKCEQRVIRPNDLITNDIEHWTAWRRWFMEMYDKVGSSTSLKKSVHAPGMSATFYGDIVIVTLGGKRHSKTIMGTYAMWLACQSVVESHEGALLYARIADLYEKYPGISLYSEVLNFLKAGRSDLIRLNNDVSSVWKAVPSMAIATVLESHEHVMSLSFSEQVRGMDPLVTTSQLYTFMMRPTPTDTEAKVRLEVGGLWKSFGFPVVDSCATATDLKTKMTEPPAVNRDAAKHCRNMFRKVFCRSFFSRHGRWPNVTLTEDVIPSIRHSVETNTWRKTGAQGWSAADFEHVTLHKSLEYDYSIDTSDLLTDKAVCTGRDDLITNYDRHAYQVIHGMAAPRQKGRETRVLTQFLCHDNLNVSDIINKIESGDVPKEWMAMVAVMKEKEGKVQNARCFCKLTAEMRLYQTSTEKNIAKSIFDYIRHQSMTMSEKELLETISTMTAPFGECSGKYGFVSLDFSRWCLTMTLDSYLPLFVELDALFGLNRVFSFSQLFPYMCRTVVQDRYRPPRFTGDEPDDGYNSWRCSTRWMEGMRQKGWTLQTQSTILAVAEERGTTATLLGQGDNQVIVVELPSESVLSAIGETASEFIQSFIRCLEEHSEQLGMVLKPEETWTSTVLFEYSKSYHFKGSNVSSGLKRASRVSSYSNDGIKTFSNRISSLYSSGSSVSGVDTSPLMGFLLTSILVCDTIMSEYQGLNDDGLAAMLCVPACLGGLPVCLMSDFMYRGKLDDLSDALGWLQYVSSHDVTLFRNISRLVDLSPSPRRDLDLLVMNPFSLNLDVPMTAENVVRRRVKKDLPTIVRNSEIQRLFSEDSSEQRRILIDDLLQIDPFNPHVASHLYKLSNISLADKIVGQYSSSRTVRQALERAEETRISETDFRSLIRAMDTAQETHFRDRLRSIDARPFSSVVLDLESDCSVTLASSLRNKSWSMEIEGVTMPCTLEQCLLTRWDSEVIEPGRTITIDIDESENLLITRGRYKPYVGSLTHMRTRRSNLSVIDSGCMISSLKKLTELLSWVVGDDSNLAQLITALCQEKTSVDIEDLKRVTRRVVGGSVQHRLADDAASRGAMINGLYNLASHARVCTDSAVEFAKQSTDYRPFASRP